MKIVHERAYLSWQHNRSSQIYSTLYSNPWLVLCFAWFAAERLICVDPFVLQLKATFTTSYIHTVILLCILNYIVFSMFVTSDILGSIDMVSLLMRKTVPFWSVLKMKVLEVFGWNSGPKNPKVCRLLLVPKWISIFISSYHWRGRQQNSISTTFSYNTAPKCSYLPSVGTTASDWAP